MALKYVHFFDKILQGHFPLFVKFTPEKSKIYGHEAEHGNFPLFQTKVIL